MRLLILDITSEKEKACRKQSHIYGRYFRLINSILRTILGQVDRYDSNKRLAIYEWYLSRKRI